MRKFFFSIVILLTSLFLSAQTNVTIKINQLPVHHPPGAALYMAGSFNGWNPKDSSFKFSRDEKGNYFIRLQLAPGSYEYKITRGSWDKAECKKGGTGIDNRSLIVPADSVDTISIEEWTDRFPAAPRKSTASKNVHIIDTAFLIPQLQRVRRVWIYLPDDYYTNQKKYPVLYMHDGQNVFDDATSYAGEWGVDEFLDSARLPKCIVVAVDHGGTKRLNEYCPYDMEKYGKGEGELYVDFLVKTLKPFIDQNYHTLTDKNNTGIAGSSMGGLISLYALLKYPEVFGKVGVFSPAIWIGPAIFGEIKNNGKKVNSKIYFYAGKMESESMVADMQKAADLLQKVSKAEIKVVVREDGKHNEAAWRKEFPLFYKWKME